MNLTAPQPLLTTSLASGIVAPGGLPDPGANPSPAEAEHPDFAKLLPSPPLPNKAMPERSLTPLAKSPDPFERGEDADVTDRLDLAPAPTLAVPTPPLLGQTPEQISGKPLPQEGGLLPLRQLSSLSEPITAPDPIEAPQESAVPLAFHKVSAQPAERAEHAEIALDESASPVSEAGHVARTAPLVDPENEPASPDLSRSVSNTAPTAPELQGHDPIPLKTAEVGVPRPAPEKQPEPPIHIQARAAETATIPDRETLEQALRAPAEIPAMPALVERAKPAEPIQIEPRKFDAASAPEIAPDPRPVASDTVRKVSAKRPKTPRAAETSIKSAANADPKPVEMRRADNRLVEEPAIAPKTDSVMAMADPSPRTAEHSIVQNAPIPDLKSAPQTKAAAAPKTAKTPQPNAKIAPTQMDAIISAPFEGPKPITAASPAIETAIADGLDSLPAASTILPSKAEPSPSAAPAISSMTMQAAPTPFVSAAVPPPNAASQPVGDAIDQIVEQVAEARAAGRDARPELTLRHNEFGQVAMRIDANGSDWRATLSARDPGFVPAVQAALAERAVAASSEAGLNQNGFSQRGQDSHSHSQSQQGSTQSNAGFGGANGGNEQRYGSSTGSSQGSAQPYLSEEGDGSAREAAADHGDSLAGTPEASRGGALFA